MHSLYKGFVHMKYIAPKFFFTRELNDYCIDIQSIASSKNLANVFTKSLPASKHWQNIGKTFLTINIENYQNL
jgi:hypothetical protein